MDPIRVKRRHHISTVAYLQSSPFAPQELPCFFTTMRTSDSRILKYVVFGSLRFLDFSFLTRHLQSPRGVHRLHINVSSPMAAGFSKSGGIATPTWCNEAESSSHTLRLTSSSIRASPWGLLLSVPNRLHVGHSVNTLTTFQANREVRLSLTHRNTRKNRLTSSANSAPSVVVKN